MIMDAQESTTYFSLFTIILNYPLLIDCLYLNVIPEVMTREVYGGVEYTLIYQPTIKYSFKIYMLTTNFVMKTGDILI